MASNPYNIAQVDAPGLLQAYVGLQRQGMQDRLLQSKFLRQEIMDQRSDRDYTDAQTIKTGLKSAYDPTTGAIDPVKARAAYVSGGDVAGAVSFDKQEAENRLKQLDTYTKINSAVVGLLGNVTDQASYDAAKAQGQALYEQFGHGMHFPELPPKYDPGTVQKLQMAALDTKDRLAAQLAQQRAAEEARHNRAIESTAAGHLSLDNTRESRLTKWGPQPLFGAAVPQHTDDLNY